MTKTTRSISLIIYIIIILVSIIKFPFYQSLIPNKYNALSEVTTNSSFITITPKTLIYSGYDVTKDNKIIGRYYYSIEDDTCYFFLLSYTHNMPDQIDHQEITGKIQSGEESYTDMLDSLKNDIEWSSNDFTQYVSSFYIDQTDSKKKTAPILFGLIMIPVIVLLLPAKKSYRK